MTIIQKLMVNMFVFAAFALAAGPSWDDAVDMNISPDTTESAASAMVREHGCWTGAGPIGVTPGHAVVRLPNDIEPSYVDAKVGFAIWLDGKPGDIIAFCR
jgi:zona occludens toxin (predicted ATPase)